MKITQDDGKKVILGLILVFVISAGARLIFLYYANSGALGNPDTAGYQGLAESLLLNWAYTTDQPAGAPGGFPADLQRPPGYPFFLSLISSSSGVNRVWVAFAQSILSGLFAVLLAIMAGRLTHVTANITPNVTIGLTTALFYAFDWVTIIHTPVVTAETLYTIVLTGAVFAFAFHLHKQSLSYSLLAGALLGAAALIKPVAQVQIVTFILAWGVQPKRRLSSLAFILTFVLCITPWMIRNYHRHQIYALSVIETSSLYFFTAQGAGYNLYGKDLDQRIGVVNAEWSVKSLSSAQKKRLMTDEAWDVIRQNWGAVVRQAANGLIRTCLGTGRETFVISVASGEAKISILWHTILPLTQISLLWALAISGVVTSWRMKLIPRPMVCMFTGTVLLALLPSAAPLGYSRFRVHAVPSLCFLAAIAVWRIFQRLNRQAVC